MTYETKEITKENREITEEDLSGYQDDKFLTFSLGNEEYGIEILYVTEIIGLQKITRVPDMPEFVKGVINLRGKVIPLIDVRLRFNLPEEEYHDRTCIIVVNMKNITVGLIVDSVSEVLDIPEEKIDPPPEVNKGNSNKFVKGLGKLEDSVKILLDIENFLFTDDVETLKNSMPEKEK